MTESGAQPSLKDRAMGWLKKPGAEKLADAKQTGGDAAKYLGRAAEEISVATGANALVQETGALGKKGLNTAGEVAVGVTSAVDRGIDRIDQTVQGIGIHIGRGAEIIQKYGALKPFGARVLERGKALVDSVAATPLAWADREIVSRVDTFLDEKVGKVVEVGKLLFADSKGNKTEGGETGVGQTEDPKDADPRLEKATSVVEGSELLKIISEGREAAIKFDQLPNATGIVIADRLLGGENTDVSTKAQEVAELRAKVIEARGDRPDISFDHEQKLIDRSENKQLEAMKIGLEILDMLPESVDDLDRTGLNVARAKAIDLARANRGFINTLSSIGQSLEARFPDKADDVRQELVKLTQPLRENNEVAQSIYDQVEVGELVRVASKDVYMSLIKGNEIFGKLSKENQDEVTKGIGATRKEGVNGRNRYDRYDSEPGSVYDTALSAYAELAKVSVAYEAMREHVAQHPEMACQLVVMAERVTQAKYALKLAKNNMQAAMTIKSKELFDAENAKSLDASHTAEEQASRKGRKDYYAKILDRQAARIAAEKPSVQKVNKFLAVTGGTAVAALGAVEAAPVVADLAPQIIDYLVKAYQFVATNFDSTVKGALGLGTLLAGAKLSEYLSGKLGPIIGKRAEDLKVRTAEESKSAVDKLNVLLATLEDTDPRKQELEEIIKGLSKS